MLQNKTLRGPWIQRLAVVVLSLILGVLLFWLLGFVTQDIGSPRGPDFSQVQAKYVDADLAALRLDGRSVVLARSEKRRQPLEAPSGVFLRH
jgi:hypothetical protein